MKRLYSIFILFLLLFLCFTNDVYAVKSFVTTPKKVKTFISSNDPINNTQISIMGSEMTIKYNSDIVSDGYQIWLYARQSVPNSEKKPLSDGRGYLLKKIDEKTTSFEETINFYQTDDLSKPWARDMTFVDGASYILVIEKNIKGKLENVSVNNIDPSEIAFNSVVLNITSKSKVPSILKYNDVINNNSKIDSGNKYHTKFYKDHTLMDIRFVLRNPKTKKHMVMTPKRIAYMKKVSNEIVRNSNAKTDYEKAQVIYKYVADNFYYDQVAFQQGKNQFANPYLNLFNMRNNKEYYNSHKSTKKAKVATTCQGYAALYISLTRAQNIPTRLVYGHRNHLPSRDWKNETNIKARDHWWAQSYINKKWIDIDPTIATSSIWKLKSKDSKIKVWNYHSIKNTVYFDPTKDQFAASHISHDVYKNNVFKYRASTVKIGKKKLKNNKVNIKWTTPTLYKEKYTQYEVYYTNVKDGKYKKLKTTKYRSHTSSKFKKNKTYYFKVRPIKKVYGITFKGQFSKVITHKT